MIIIIIININNKFYRSIKSYFDTLLLRIRNYFKINVKNF